jgi:hypothetical protein
LPSTRRIISSGSPLPAEKLTATRRPWAPGYLHAGGGCVGLGAALGEHPWLYIMILVDEFVEFGEVEEIEEFEEFVEIPGIVILLSKVPGIPSGFFSTRYLKHEFTKHKT